MNQNPIIKALQEELAKERGNDAVKHAKKMWGHLGHSGTRLCQEDFKMGHEAASARLLSIVEELYTALSVSNETLLWCEEMLKARDEMNSKVHCAPVRLSPITERVIKTREFLLSLKGSK